jgi:hypothetical protein
LAGQPVAPIGRLSPPLLLLLLVDGICELRLRLVLSALLLLLVLLLLPAAVVCQSDERRGVHHHPKIELAI